VKIIEQLQSGGAWQAAISGGFPTDLASLGGVVTQIPAQIGMDLLGNVTQGLDVLSSLSSSPRLHHRRRGGRHQGRRQLHHQSPPPQRERNYAQARVGYLSEARGIRLAGKALGLSGLPRRLLELSPGLPSPRTIACPIWDPLGTPTNLPSWMVPVRLVTRRARPATPGGPTIRRRLRSGIPSPRVMLRLGRHRPRYSAIADCDADAKKHGDRRMALGLAPLQPPPRRRFDSSGTPQLELEKIVAAQYMLPTAQHVLTSASDVAESKSESSRGCHEVLVARGLRGRPR
jgi:hypothetical protein